MLLSILLAYAAPPPPPIVNGAETDNYPQAVMLRHATADWRTVYICTGTLSRPIGSSRPPTASRIPTTRG